MARPKGGINRKYLTDYKEQIIKEYLTSEHGLRYYERKYNIAYMTLHNWYEAYIKDGKSGLISRQGKSGKSGRYNRNKNEIDKLKEEILKRDIELMRLKKVMW